MIVWNKDSGSLTWSQI